MVVLILCVVAVASEAMPGAGHPGLDDVTTAAAVQTLRATLRAFEAQQAVPKPLPQSHNVEMWLGGVQYKSRMSPPWTDTATGRRLRLATGFGRRDVVVPVESDRPGNGGTSSTSWRVRPFREYGFGESQVVRVSPSGLDFGVRESCIPTLLSVEVSYRADATDGDDGVDSPTNELLPLQIHGIEIHDKQFLLADVFQPLTLQPGDVHKFHVLFLPHRHSSAIHSTLTFQTSLGDIPYPLRGSAVPNRYQVSEFTASIAAGVQYDPIIYLYNPHHKMLRVKEVFTTEGFLHMELPQHPLPSGLNASDGSDTSQDVSTAAATAARGVWEIESAAMKPVMQLSFLSSTPGHYSAYVRIETDFDNLIVPVELTVLSEGLHLGATHLNFGVLVNDDEEHHIAVDFVNTGRTTVLVKGVSLRSPDSRISVVIQGSHAVGPMSRVKHAMVVSYGSVDPGTFTGMLIVHTNDTTTVNPSTHGRGHGGDIWLNYTATKVSGGGLSFAPDDVQFTSCGGPGRGLVLTNHFDTAVAIEMVQLADPSLFSLHNFSGNAVADAGTSWPPIYFDCIIDVDENGTTTSPTLSSPITTHTHSHLLVQTNVSRHVIPLVLSSNRLTLQSSSKRWQVMSTDDQAAAERVRTKGDAEGKAADVARPKSSPRLSRRAFRLDLGNISSSRHVLVNLTNFNPTAIPVHSIVAHLASVEASLEPMAPHLAASVIAHEGQSTADTLFADDSDEDEAACSADPPLSAPHTASSTKQPRSCRSKSTKATVIPPGYALPMVLHITPTTPAVKDVLAFTISTSAETIDVYLTYTQVRGSISPTRRKLRTTSPLYPGRAEVVPLYVDSTFDFPVAVSAIRVSDRRVQVLSQASDLAPNATTLVAQLVVSPAYALGCASPDKFADCMLPVPIGGGDWMASPGTASGALSTFGQPVTQADVNAHFQRLQRFADLETQGDTLVEMKVIVYTDLVAVAPVVVRMPIARPRLVVDNPTSAGMVEMPLTHVGNVSDLWLTVTNPSNLTIDVALALLASKDTDDGGASGGFYTCPGSSPSKLAGCQETWMASATSGPGAAVGVPAFFLASMTKQSLAPGDVTTLGPILFAPTAAKEFVGRLYLRNTLSHIEPVVVRGQGGQGHVSVVNNVVLESHAPPQTLALQNDGNLPLVLHGWSCPKCGGCDGNDAGFCVQFPGSEADKTTAGAFPVVLAPHGSSLFHLNVSFVSACYFNHERESVVFHTSSGKVSVELDGAVAYPYRECLGTSRMSYFYLGFRVVVWGLFALVVSQIVHYTVQIVWMDCHTIPADTNFGYNPPVVPADSAASTLRPDGIDADLLEDELQSIETQVFDSFTFAPIRSPAVQRLLDQRKAAQVKKSAPVVSKKKAKPKKVVPPTQPVDLVAVPDKANSVPSDDEGAAKVAASAEETPPLFKPAAADKPPKSQHKTPLAKGSKGNKVEMNRHKNAATVPSTSDQGETEAAYDKDMIFVKDGQLQPAIATTVSDASHETEKPLVEHTDKLSSATQKTEHVAEPDAVPASNNEYTPHPVAQEDQDLEQLGGQATAVGDVCVVEDSVVAAIDADMDFADTVDISPGVDSVVRDDDVIDSDGDVIDSDCDDTSDAGDAEGGDRSQSSGEADTEEIGDNVEPDEAVESDEPVEDEADAVDDNVQDDDDDGSLDNGTVDDLSWAVENNPVVSNVDQTNRDNTIVLDEIDQLMQEVHNEQQFLQQHQELYPSPERGSPASWHLTSQPHSSHHEAFAMPSLHPSFPPATPSLVAAVRAPPGFSAADADPLAVSRAYSQMGHLTSPSVVPPPDTNAFKAPLVLFGSSYFTGHRPGFIGSHRQSRGGPSGMPPAQPGPPHRFNHEPPLKRNQYHSQGRSLASLVAGDAPFESSRDVFLNPESSPMQQRDGRFSFW